MIQTPPAVAARAKDASDKSLPGSSNRLQFIETHSVFAEQGRAGMLGLPFCPRRQLKPSLQPSPANRQPPTANRQPTTDHRPPTTDHRPPKTENRKPKTDHRPPKTENRKPKTENYPNLLRKVCNLPCSSNFDDVNNSSAAEFSTPT